MKKFLVIIFALVSISAAAQEVASQSVTLKCQWYFAGQAISVDNFGNKTIQTKWIGKDSLSGAVIKTDIFAHSDSDFNAFWDSFDGFAFLVKELSDKEHLSTQTSAQLEASFYNRHVARPARRFMPQGQK